LTFFQEHLSGDGKQTVAFAAFSFYGYIFSLFTSMFQFYGQKELLTRALVDRSITKNSESAYLRSVALLIAIVIEY